METKKDIRKRVLTDRSQMASEKWWEKSLRISEKITTHPFFLNADEIYCYINYRNEVGTRSIFEAAWKYGKKTAAPKICDNHMNFFYIQSFDDLKEGSFGIQEPTGNEIAEGNNVLIIMPGAVFDKEKNRIGYGKGFYDGYLTKHPDYHSIALAFSLQVLDRIPTESHDIKPEVLITEEEDYV